MTQRRPPANAAKRYAPPTLRDREPIREVLAGVLPERGRVLEIASGSGQPIVFFATAFPMITWQPSDADADPDCPASIGAWAAGMGGGGRSCQPRRRAAPRRASACVAGRSGKRLQCGAVHQHDPHRAVAGLAGPMASAPAVLKTGGPLVRYGPFKVNGRHTAPSNAAFDQQLGAMDAAYGVRDTSEVEAEAAAHGLMLERQVPMPTNNLTLVFCKHHPRP
jgi:hypothetical protein